MSEKELKHEELVTDQASVEMLDKAAADCADTCFARYQTQKNQCSFGRRGICCRLCYMGPCRITVKAPRGICGADADTIVARNYLREVAGGAAAHSDHGRHLVELLRNVAKGSEGGYAINDVEALKRSAKLYGIEVRDRDKSDIALELADRMMQEFSTYEEKLKTLSFAPLKRQGVWKRFDLEPLGIDQMLVQALHRSTMGVDHDYRHILTHAFRTALSDGWGGSRIATMVSDILFGTPFPVRSKANLGVLEEKKVNILVHGHEPAVSEMLSLVANDPDLVKEAKTAGAEGINLAGICCTANEILIRHGIPLAGNFLQQELAVITGAVEMMLIDVQCCMPSLPSVAKAYHTKIVSTSEIAKTLGAEHETFDFENAKESAKKLIRSAIENFKKRDPAKVAIPESKNPLVAGFSVEAIKYMLGGNFRSSFRPLNDAIMQGRIKGVVGIVGCNNPKIKMDSYMTTLTKELIGENVLVLNTGCAGIASAKHGLLKPETALEQAGKGLREVCEAVGMPPVLHMGSCVDNTRILEAATEVVSEGGLGDDLSDIPAVGVAPEWMSEKAVAIGCYFVASGVDVVLGHAFHISGSEKVTNFMNKEIKADFGACFHVHEDPHEAAAAILKILDEKRDRLGINKKVERKLLDMKDRREINV
jgi:carbon-monoxide dehydrogenase catalytic subunit